jgi:hypothetical protein
MSQNRTSGEALRKLRQRVFSMYGTECWLCGGDGADTIDHIIPVVQGGGDDLDNLRPAHGRKSKTCVGNFSRKRPMVSSVTRTITTEAGITYGDGWVEKFTGSMRCRIYNRAANMADNDPFIEAWIRS